MKSLRKTIGVRRWRVLLLGVLALLPLSGFGQAVRQLDITPVPEPALQASLEQIVEANGWGKLADSGAFATTLVVFDEHGGYRLAAINGQRMIYAASLPKIAILFAAMVAAQDGELEIDSALREDLNKMIRVSCNACATRSMERVGRERLLEILQRPEYRFYEKDGFGGLWVGKGYSEEGAHARDPLKGLSHGANTFQVARMYYRLEMGSLLDPVYTRMMLDMLARPGISHKFVKALSDESGIEMWRKSGSWQDFHADSVLVHSDAGRYILVSLLKSADGEVQLQRLADDIHDLLESF